MLGRHQSIPIPAQCRSPKKSLHRGSVKPKGVGSSLNRLFFLVKDVELRIVSLIVRGRELAEDVVVLDEGSTDETVKLAQEVGATVQPVQEGMSPQGLARCVLDHALEADSMLVVKVDDAWKLAELGLSVNRSRGQWDLHIAYLKPTNDAFELDNATLGELAIRHVVISATGCRTLSQLPELAEVAHIPSDLRVRFVQLEPPIVLSQRESLATASRFAQLFYWMLESKHPLLLFGIPGLVLFVLGYRLSGDIGTLLLEVNSTSIGVTLVTVAMTLIGLFAMMVALILYIMGKQVERVQHQYNWPKQH